MARMLAAAVSLLLVAGTLATGPEVSHADRKREFNKRKQDIYEHQQETKRNWARQANDSSSYRFLTDDTAPYRVESLPMIPFDVGEMYSGLIPIDEADPDRALFFVFQPKLNEVAPELAHLNATVAGPVDEITIWFNGGPGCSSLEGFLQENGRFKWDWGIYEPYLNQYSWANLTNMLWVEQPIGTGFSQGTVTASTEEEIAQDFIKFFKNFQKLFGIKKFKIYVTGESYAGIYVPYVASAMIDADDLDYYDVRGMLVYDPCIGSCSYTQARAPVVPHVLENKVLYNFNESFIKEIEELHSSCGYKEYYDKYLTFPASGVQPVAPDLSDDCRIDNVVTAGAARVNPCFNPYEIVNECPILFDPLAFPGLLYLETEGFGTYFNLPDVKKALHVPTDLEWAECSGPVFTDAGDTSLDPIQHVLPKVIEKTNRVLVSNGDLDLIIITNGTLLAIQNMTWNGKLGFQREPKKPVNIKLPDLQYQENFVENGLEGFDGPGQGIMGVQHYERGLLFSRTYMSGHMQPQFQPRVAYRQLQWVLGRVKRI